MANKDKKPRPASKRSATGKKKVGGDSSSPPSAAANARKRKPNRKPAHKLLPLRKPVQKPGDDGDGGDGAATPSSKQSAKPSSKQSPKQSAKPSAKQSAKPSANVGGVAPKDDGGGVAPDLCDGDTAPSTGESSTGGAALACIFPDDKEPQDKGISRAADESAVADGTNKENEFAAKKNTNNERAAAFDEKDGSTPAKDSAAAFNREDDSAPAKDKDNMSNDKPAPDSADSQNDKSNESTNKEHNSTAKINSDNASAAASNEKDDRTPATDENNSFAPAKDDDNMSNGQPAPDSVEIENKKSNGSNTTPIFTSLRGKSFRRLSTNTESSSKKEEGQGERLGGFHPKRPRQSRSGSERSLTKTPSLGSATGSATGCATQPGDTLHPPLKQDDGDTLHPPLKQDDGDTLHPPPKQDFETPLSKRINLGEQHQQAVVAPINNGITLPSRQAQENPLISPHEYHLRVCLPRKHRQARHKMQLMMMEKTLMGHGNNHMMGGGGGQMMNSNNMPGRGGGQMNNSNMPKGGGGQMMSNNNNNMQGGGGGRMNLPCTVGSGAMHAMDNNRSLNNRQNFNESSMISTNNSFGGSGSNNRMTNDLRMEMISRIMDNDVRGVTKEMKLEMMSRIMGGGSMNDTELEMMNQLMKETMTNQRNSVKNSMIIDGSGGGSGTEGMKGVSSEMINQMMRENMMNDGGNVSGGGVMQGMWNGMMNQSMGEKMRNGSGGGNAGGGGAMKGMNESMMNKMMNQMNGDGGRRLCNNYPTSDSDFNRPSLNDSNNFTPRSNNSNGNEMSSCGGSEANNHRGVPNNNNGFPSMPFDKAMTCQDSSPADMRDGSGNHETERPNSRNISGVSNDKSTRMVPTGAPLRGRKLGTGNMTQHHRSNSWGSFGDTGASSLGGMGGSLMGRPTPTTVKESVFDKTSGLSSPSGNTKKADLRDRMMNMNSDMMNNPDLMMNNEMMMNNPDYLRQRKAMLQTMNRGTMGGMGGGGIGSQVGRMMDTPVTSMRPTFGDEVDRNGVNTASSNDAANSLLAKQKFFIDQQFSMMMGDSGGDPGGILRSPMPKKSFLNRERIMDAEMRNHMNDAMAGLKKHHRRASPGLAIGGDMSKLDSGMSGGNDVSSRAPPFHPNMSMASHQTPMENYERNTMESQTGGMIANMKHMELPSLTTPTEDTITGNTETVQKFSLGPDNAITLDDDSLPLKMMKSSHAKTETSAKQSKKLSTKALSKSSSSDKQASKKSKQKETKDINSSGGSKKSKKAKSSLDKKKAKEALSALAMASAVLPDKPKRPFSAYNLFFQMEREFIMQEISDGRKPREDPSIKTAMANAKANKAGDEEKAESATAPTSKEEDDDMFTLHPPSKANVKPQPNSGDDSKYFFDPNIPPRYAHLRMDKHWYSVGHKQKRKHRKTKGSCGFIELTKMVSAHWKMIDKTDPNIKQYCQLLADLELETYKRAMTKYKSCVKKAELEAKTKVLMEVDERDKAVKKSEMKRLIDEAVEGGTVVGQKKKRLKKEEAKVAASQDRSSTPTEAQAKPQTTDFGGGGDMSRLTDFSFSGMSGPFHGAMTGPFDGALDTPRTDGFCSGMCGDAGDGRTDPNGNVSSLPPPPFASNDGSLNGARIAEHRKKESQFVAMKEAQLKARMAAAGANFMQENSHRDTCAEARNAAPNDDIKKKFAALKEAEARHRMQMEMQGGMMGSRAMHEGQQQDWHGFGMPRDAFTRDNMQRMPQGGRAVGGSGDSSDLFPPHDSKSALTGEGTFLPRSTAGASGLPSPTRRQFMERFGADMPGAGNMPRGLPRYPPLPTNGAPTTIDTNAQEDQFDKEVERFLSCLGQEIKEKHRRNHGGRGDTSALASDDLASNVATDFGENFSNAGIGAAMGMGAASAGLPNQMSMGMPMGTRAEMMADMMKNGGSGNINHNAANQPHQEMVTQMMMKNGGSGNINHNAANQPNQEMMAQMMMRNNGGNAANHPNQERMARMMMMRNNDDIANYPNQERMAQMIMMRNSCGGAGNNSFGMMPQPPFDGNEFQQHQQGVAGGSGGQNFTSDSLGGDDDNPALPEYGWGQNGANRK